VRFEGNTGRCQPADVNSFALATGSSRHHIQHPRPIFGHILEVTRDRCMRNFKAILHQIFCNPRHRSYSLVFRAGRPERCRSKKADGEGGDVRTDLAPIRREGSAPSVGGGNLTQYRNLSRGGCSQAGGLGYRTDSGNGAKSHCVHWLATSDAHEWSPKDEFDRHQTCGGKRLEKVDRPAGFIVALSPRESGRRSNQCGTGVSCDGIGIDGRKGSYRRGRQPRAISADWYLR
jgi:hypothetical protein